VALSKQSVNINFAQGLDTKTDPFQVSAGKFLSLQNSVFTKGGLLQKRNGFGKLPSLPDNSNTYLTTFNGNLTAIGTSLNALVNGSSAWVNKGAIQPVELGTLPIIRSNTNQSYADSAVSSNNLVCTVFIDNVPSGGVTTPVYKYVVADVTTGQNVSAPQQIPIPSGAVVTAPKVVVLENNFLIIVSILDAGVNYLKYLRVGLNTPTLISTPVTISATYMPSSTGAVDAAIVSDTLFIAWNGNDNAIHMTALLSNLQQINTIIVGGYVATLLSVCIDSSGVSPIIYVSFYDSGSQNGYTFSTDTALNIEFNPVLMISAETVDNITSSAYSNSCALFYEVDHNYSYDSAIPTHFIKKRSISSSGVPGSATVMVKSVGLASKAFIINGNTYMLSVYFSVFQPTYFLLNSNGQVLAKLAYENAGGYLTNGLPDISVSGSTAYIPYLFKDLIESVNKEQGAANAAGVYSQTGINLASFNLEASINSTAEIGQDLHLTGGFLWMYDGYTPVEHLFHLWPDNVEASWSATGGNVHAKPDGSTNTNAYFYQVTYEWTDNQGNAFRSAPSIPVSVTTTGSGTAGSITLHIPTLRLTYKLANPVKIVIYRWSVGQQIYYQTTSINVPILNDTTVDSVDYVDTNADSSITGNNIIYTTGGVIENIAAPAVKTLTLFDTRLFFIDAEDQNLLRHSKQVIENVPVETSDVFTIYVSPTSAAQGPTGPMTALAPLDDKLIIFKKNAIYYINGTGPDNTGANNQYSQPTFITATVGSTNQKSIVFMPQGLMFQSDKGIWLLSRDLGTQYIGAPVESLTQGATVLSAINIPGTNQVRFTLDSGITLMYDYYYGQWGTFVGIQAVASVLYEDLHSFINDSGEAFQENPGSYLDGSNPVLLSFTTSWMNLTGLQGFQRAYFFYLLGVYYSPHKLNLQIAYDYNASPSQNVIISPTNFTPNYGDSSPYGDPSPYGGEGNVEQWRVFLQKQRCQAFQITLNEVYDATFGKIAGQGLTLSGLNLIYSSKSAFFPISNAHSAGK
jgi:hypothetical protein